MTSATSPLTDTSVISSSSPVPTAELASCNPLGGLVAAYVEGYRLALAHHSICMRAGHVIWQLAKDLIFLGLGLGMGLLQFSAMLAASPVVWIHKKLSFGQFLLLLRAICLEACCGFASYATRFTRPQYVAPAQPKSDSPVIILIHGLMHNGAAWNYQRSQLVKAGYDVICPSWGGPFQNLETAAKKVNDIWEATKAEHPHLSNRPLLLVGHSTGYAIAQTLLKQQKFNDKPVAYVSMCGPTEGTHLATLIPFSELVRELRPGSWPNSLTPENHKTFKRKACRVIEVEHDVMIWSRGLERDENADIPRKLYNAGGHSSLLFADVTTETIIDAAEALSMVASLDANMPLAN